MDFLTALLLGLIQGITALLPISSVGHLILAREVFTVDTINTLALESTLYLASALAILTYFWSEVWILLQSLIRKLGRLPTNKKDINLLYALFLGSIPAIVLGVFFEEIISGLLQKPVVVSTMLFVGAVFLMYTEWRYYLKPPQGYLTPKTGFMIGLFQVMSMIPGLSRTASTLAGGMLLGLTRLESARFSFLLAIPLMLGLGAKRLLDLMSVKGEIDRLPIALAVLVSYIVALISIRIFLSFISRYTLWPFIWYNIILACLVTYVALFV